MGLRSSQVPLKSGGPRLSAMAEPRPARWEPWISTLLPGSCTGCRPRPSPPHDPPKCARQEVQAIVSWLPPSHSYAVRQLEREQRTRTRKYARGRSRYCRCRECSPFGTPERRPDLLRLRAAGPGCTSHHRVVGEHRPAAELRTRFGRKAEDR